MKKKYFGTDGIRGKVGSLPIVQSFFFKLAVSLARSKKNIKKINYEKKKNCKSKSTKFLF